MDALPNTTADLQVMNADYWQNLYERTKKLETALRKIAEITECECRELAFRDDCINCLASNALRRESVSGTAAEPKP
jgi:hypothetical protein